MVGSLAEEAVVVRRLANLAEGVKRSQGRNRSEQRKGNIVD